MTDQPDRRSKKQLLGEIERLNIVLSDLRTTYQERLKARTEEVDDLMHQLTAKKEELYRERKEHDETKKELKVTKGHIASAISAAEEGATASGIANRIVIRLMDENERLRHETQRLRNDK